MAKPTRNEILTKYDQAFTRVGLGSYALDLSDCDDEFIVALGRFCQEYADAKEDDSCGQNI